MSIADSLIRHKSLNFRFKSCCIAVVASVYLIISTISKRGDSGSLLQMTPGKFDVELVYAYLLEAQ